MILKVYRFSKEGDPIGFWMHDSIIEISKLGISLSAKDIGEYRDHTAPIKYDFVLLDTHASTGAIDCVILECKMSNTNKFSVIFDTSARIFNDGGMTIEKIAAMYQPRSNVDDYLF